MRYRLAIFDFDGTLADSFPAFLTGLDAAAARFGFRAIDDADLERVRSFTPWQVIEHIDVAMWQVPMIAQFVRGRMAEAIDSVALFPGVHEALEDLAVHGVRIAIVSSNTESAIRHVLGSRLASLVADYRCDVSLFGKRPKLRQVLGAAGIPPEQAIAVGDEVRDLRAARAESVDFAAVTWGFTGVPALAAEHPEFMVANVEDLLDVIGGEAGPAARPA